MKSFITTVICLSVLHLTAVGVMFIATFATWDFGTSQSELNKTIDSITTFLMSPIWIFVEDKGHELSSAAKVALISANSLLWGSVMAVTVHLLKIVRR